MAAFEEFGVLPEIAKAIDELEWTLPTDVQAEAVPLVLGGGDVLMAAETGSGKTAAFCMPILQIVWEALKNEESGGGGGGGGSGGASSSAGAPLWTMSKFDRGSALAVAACGLRVQSREQREWHGARCTNGVRSGGRWAFEAVIADEGLCRVGWSTAQASLDLGTDKFGYGYGGTGKKSNNRQFDSYGESFGKGDVIGCLLDLDAGEIAFTKNGVPLGTAFTLPAPLRSSTAFFPAITLKNAELEMNFGATPFKHAPPTGYQALNAAPSARRVNNEVTGTPVAAAAGSKDKASGPRAIIIEPSRELAEQTLSQLDKLGKHLEDPRVRSLLVIGGVAVRDQMTALAAGVDVVVGTPGRLEDLIQGGYLSLSRCRFFVLDEADALLKQGYTELIERLHKQMPTADALGRRLQMIVCSATLHAHEVRRMADRLMHFPTWVDLKGEDAVPETVHHVVVQADPRTDQTWRRSRYPTDGVHARDGGAGTATQEQLSEALKMMKGEFCVRAIDKHRMERAIIFCRTKLDCDNLERHLRTLQPAERYSCVCLHGDRKPAERRENLERFKRGQARFLICTDVAARGLDITGLPFAINVTLPDDKANYVHRVGRVGRADRMGLAISLVGAVPEKVWYHGEWCRTRGRNCYNTRLTTDGGCCIWLNEMQLLADVEAHLNVTVQQVSTDLAVPCDEFDGKVVYGERRKRDPANVYQNHTAQLEPVARDLAHLESRAQLIYLRGHLSGRRTAAAN